MGVSFFLLIRISHSAQHFDLTAGEDEMTSLAGALFLTRRAMSSKR
jgi:hypothetical protein